jgi:single stranded DNA-binding protein
MSLSQITIADCRLTRDAETKATTGGQTVLHFSVAADRRTKKDGKWGSVTTFWDCDLWGKQGEAIAQYMTKGKLISLTGEAYIDTWEQDGVKKMKAKINLTAWSLRLSSQTRRRKVSRTTYPRKCRSNVRKGCNAVSRSQDIGQPIPQRPCPRSGSDPGILLPVLQGLARYKP